MPYPLDLTGSAASNRIVDELHISTEQYIHNHYYIFPQYVSFYKNSLIVKVYNGSSWATLTPNVDYIFKCIHVNATRLSGQELYGFIELINPTANQTVSLTYQTLGGSKQPDTDTLINKIIDDYKDTPIYILDVLTTDFDPAIQTSTPSFSQYPNTKGELEVVEKLHDIANSIASGFTSISALFKTYAKPVAIKGTSSTDFSVYVDVSGDQLNMPFSVVTFPSEQNSIVNKSYVETAFNAINTAYNNLLNLYNNKLNKLNPVSNNPLYLTIVDAANTNTALTKEYVENALSSFTQASSDPPVGTVIQSAVDNTPSGYLKCNGAIVSKTTYSGLYNVIGDSFTDITYTAITRPWENQYEFSYIPTQDLSLLTISNMNSLPYETSDIGVFATRNKIYLVGGYSTNDPSRVADSLNKVYSYKLDENSNLIDFNTESNFPVYGYDISCDVVHNRVYAFVPRPFDSNSNYLPSSIYSSQIDNEGNILSWQLETTINVLDVNNNLLYLTSSVIIGNKYYVAGFNNDDFITNYCYVSTINIDGTLSPFTQTTPLPNGLTLFKFIVIKNKLYLIGGQDTNYNSNYNIYSCDINSDFTLGTWTTVSYLVDDLYIPAVYVTHNTLYIFSIVSGYKKMYMVDINSDGTLNDFIEKNIEFDLGFSSLCATKNYIYLFGSFGFDNNINNYAGTSNIYITPINTQYNDYHQFYQLQHQTLPPGHFQLPNYHPDFKSIENWYIRTGV